MKPNETSRQLIFGCTMWLERRGTSENGGTVAHLVLIGAANGFGRSNNANGARCRSPSPETAQIGCLIWCGRREYRTGRMKCR
jgi:hypothetical protein